MLPQSRRAHGSGEVAFEVTILLMSSFRRWVAGALAAAAVCGCSVYNAVPSEPSGGGSGGSAIATVGSAGEGGDNGTDPAGGAATGAGDTASAGGAAGRAGDAGGAGGVVAMDAAQADGARADRSVPDAIADVGKPDTQVPDAPPVDAAAGREASTVVPMDGGAIDATEECIRETRSAFCLRIGKNCGPVTGTDNCGISINVDCGICVPLEGCGGTGIVNVCGAPPNLAQGGTVTASNPGNVNEEMTKAFDGDGMTKYFVFATKTPWLAYEFGQSATHVVNAYGVASANDFPVRDPSAWLLEGSNDGTTWATLDTRTGQIFANRLQTNIYPCANTTAYSHYRFSVTANNGSPDTQVAEIMLFGD